MAKKAAAKDVNAATDALIKTNMALEPARLKAWDSMGLTVTQLRVLFHLADNDGMGNAELAGRLDVTRPSVSALLERLERGGFIRREISRADRRGIRILLQPEGREAVAGAKGELRKEVGALLGDLDEDQLKQLTAALAQVTN